MIDVRAFHGAHPGTWTVEVRTEDGGYVLPDLYRADWQKLIRDLGEAAAQGDSWRSVIERWAGEIDEEFKRWDRLMKEMDEELKRDGMRTDGDH